MSQQYIFTIESLTRIHDQKEVLHDIWMAFFPGAKIGVLGNNGAGKSSLLRIMAGEDDGYEGTARPGNDLVSVRRASRQGRFDVDIVAGKGQR